MSEFNLGKCRKRRLALLLTLSSVIIVALTVCIFSVNKKYENGIVILGYHGVVSDEEKNTLKADDKYTLSVSQFRTHMQYLYENGYKTLSMQELLDYCDGKIEDVKKTVVLTFDDGYKNFNEVVKPIIEEFGFKATCFVIGKHTDDDREEFLKSQDIVNTENVEYYSHSYDLHRTAKGINKKIIEVLSKEEIDNDFKKNTVSHEYFAFPYGRSRNDIDDILENNGVKLAFSYNQYRKMTRNDDRYFLPRYMILDSTPLWYLKLIAE